jgi:hypothetical protein
VLFKQRNKQGSWASSHKSGGLVSVLALGPSACPKNARDLTLSILELINYITVMNRMGVVVSK